MRLTPKIGAALAGVLALTGCAALGSEADRQGEQGGTVVVATHDSWAMSKEVIAQFEKESGYTVKIQPQGDAGQLTNKLVLTKDDPIADVAYGIDNTFASRAVENGVLADLGSAKGAIIPKYAYQGEGSNELLPIDYGDVCVNVDDTWFAKKHLTPPATLDDLTDPRYKGLFVTPAANTSSPGMAFLLATIGEYGRHWPAYWKKLMANGTKVDAGWTDAYEVDFTQGGGKGTRPIVLSYSSSPPFTIPKGQDKPTTSALLDTCFRQVEYGAVLHRAQNPKGARAFLEFMVGKEFQTALPEQMYVYPVSAAAVIPEDWAKWAPVAKKPLDVDPALIAKNRAGWLARWRDIVTG